MASGDNNNNNNDHEEDPWAELFDRAEGKITLGNDEQRYVDTVESPTAKRPKLHHGTNKASKATRRSHGKDNDDDDNASFQDYLRERSAFQTQMRSPYIVLKEAFSTTTTTATTSAATAAADNNACQEWKGVAPERQQQNKKQASCCQSCGRSSFYHRASVNKENDDDDHNYILLPLQLYCLLRNLRHVAILFLTSTSNTAEQTTVLGHQQNDTVVGDDAYFHVGRPLQGECKRLAKLLQERVVSSQQPELASSLQSKFTTLQTLLHHHHQQQEAAFKKQKKQHTASSSNNNDSSSSTMSVQQRQQQQQQKAREGAIRIIMQCDECYYQLYYLEISRQLIPGLFLSSSVSSSKQDQRGGRGGFAAAGMYIPHPTVYFGESFTITNETRSSSSNNNNNKHYLDSARDLVSTWNSSLDHSSVVARFQLDFEQRQEQQQSSAASASGKSPMDVDALSALHYIRFLETITFFDLPKDTSWLSSLSSSSSVPSSLLSKRDKSSSSASSSSSSSSLLTAPPPAPALLMEWRDSCRDFLTHLYAYATLPPELISRILKTCRDEGIHNIIEMGAGTGYVANLLNVQQQQQQQGIGSNDNIIGVEAYDLLPTPTPPPPSSSANGATPPTTTRMNEYHGGTPPFTHVAKASCTQAMKNSNVNNSIKTALLLCYPPPDSSMALDAVQMFCSSTNNSSNSSNSTRKKRRRQRHHHQSRGESNLISGSNANNDTVATSGAAGSLVIYIGEFQGLTGTRELERYLMQNFDCLARHACPSWGTDATSVTIWKARRHAFSSSSSSPSLSLLIPCHYCQEKPAKKRMRFMRHLEYCSNACFQADCQSGVVYQHAKCNRLYLGGDGITCKSTGDITVAAVNDTAAGAFPCALDFENKQHFLDLT